MPPKIKVDRQIILDAALTILREKGWEAVNAREIAKAIGCSTQPIFREFANMADMKNALLGQAWAEYGKFMAESRTTDAKVGLILGVAYIIFAQKESNIFKMIFMSDSLSYKSLYEMIYSIDNTEKIIEIFMGLTGFDRDKAYRLHFKMWMFMHGLATMAATNKCIITDEEITFLIKDCLSANAEFMRCGEKGTITAESIAELKAESSKKGDRGEKE